MLPHGRSIGRKRVANLVIGVDREGYYLENGEYVKHPFRLSSDWTVEQMQIVLDCCRVDDRSKKYVRDYGISKADLIAALELSGYSQTKAAAMLGVPIHAVCRRAKKYGITHPSRYKGVGPIL